MSVAVKKESRRIQWPISHSSYEALLGCLQLGPYCSRFSSRVLYLAPNPDRLRHTNPDAVFCLSILLLTPLIPFWAVTYSIKRWKADPLPHPAWNRNPLRWWRDPLQAHFVLTRIMATTAIGSAVRLPPSDQSAFGHWGCTPALPWDYLWDRFWSTESIDNASLPGS